MKRITTFLIFFSLTSCLFSEEAAKNALLDTKVKISTGVRLADSFSDLIHSHIEKARKISPDDSEFSIVFGPHELLIVTELPKEIEDKYSDIIKDLASDIYSISLSRYQSDQIRNPEFEPWPVKDDFIIEDPMSLKEAIMHTSKAYSIECVFTDTSVILKPTHTASIKLIEVPEVIQDAFGTEVFANSSMRLGPIRYIEDEKSLIYVHDTFLRLGHWEEGNDSMAKYLQYLVKDAEKYLEYGSLGIESFIEEMRAPNPTERTPAFDDYTSGSYHVNKFELFDKAKDDDVRCIVITGPGGPLWTYHVVTVLENENELLVNWLIFPHARITAKKTKTITQGEFDSFIEAIKSSESLTSPEEGNTLTDDYQSEIAILYRIGSDWTVRYATTDRYNPSEEKDYTFIYDLINKFLESSIVTYPKE